MIIKTIDQSVLDHFVKEHPNKHYQKTSMYGDFLAFSQKATIQYLGFYQDQQIIATAMIMFKSYPLIGTYGYIPMGLCLDYNQKEQLERCLDALVHFAQVKKLIFLKLDPNVIRIHRDLQGKPLNDGFLNEWVSELLKTKGFKHKGYGYAYDGSWNNRFTLVLDLDQPFDSLYKGFAKSKKSFYKRQQRMGIKTYQTTSEDCHILASLEKELTKKEGFYPKSEAYFKQLMQIYGEHTKLKKTIMNVTDNILIIDQELNSSKYRNDKEAYDAKVRQKEELLKIQATHGSEIVLAIGLFVVVGDWSWDLYSYKNPEFAKYNGTDHLHIETIKDFQAGGVKHYDFVGFSGVTDPSDFYYGLYQFKSSFNPRFVEHIGEFDLILNEKKHNLFNTFQYYKMKIKRRILHILYKKTDKNEQT